jgi:hypothetical protein
MTYKRRANAGRHLNDIQTTIDKRSRHYFGQYKKEAEDRVLSKAEYDQ